MKIQQFCDLTHSTKKTIHYYIDQGLLTPYQNHENGYYEFNEADIKQMEILQTLRFLDLSIQEIKECLKYPTLTNYFLHRHIHDLKIDIQTKVRKLNYIYNYLEQIPPNATPNNLLDCTLSPNINDQYSLIDSLFPEIDARMIGIIIFAPFLAGEVSEYHVYLWDKISDELTVILNDCLPFYQRLIYTLTPKQIIEATSATFYKFKLVLDTNNIESLSSQLIENIRLFIKDDNYAKLWNAIYQPLLYPLFGVNGSKFIKLLKEYSNNFNGIGTNLKLIIDTTYQTLKYTPLMNQLFAKLGTNITLDDSDHSDLFLMFYFFDSIFTQLSYTTYQSKIFIK